MREKLWVKQYASKMNRPLRNEIRKTFHSGKSSAALPVIVQFKHKITPSRMLALHKHLGAHSFAIKHRIPMLNALSSRVSVNCLKRLCCWEGVHKVHLDHIKSISLDIATPSIGAAAVQSKRGLTGKGINIAVLDTGVFPHPDLVRPVNRIVAFKDFVNHRKRPYDDNGHGTHITGDAAGNGWSSRGKYRGPAPEAGIVGVKVLDINGDGYDSTIIKGIEWCIAEKKRLKLRILSMSFGGPISTSCRDDLLCQAVEKAVQAGLTVVIAAGNSGPGRKTIESPGISPAAVTVGAVDDRRTLPQKDDRITFYSSRGPTPCGKIKPDLVAPGESVISLRAPGSQLARNFPYLRIGKQYFVLSGTSVSTPIVSGAAAQLLQSCPSLTPRQVKARLKRNAFRLGLKPNTAGSGEINMRFLLGKR
ncbi:S8 family peptidase [Paenibacillus riograndensis]|uniref:Peptidase S8 and S53 subtilisin kexin sedolisin n=1 Tax=Paenibacillus riograndensis SBR5 TaxID=1073571 RepID=A0A0E4H8V7_9BACL|nr:S8 family peptidase [Paenibacillus riograndensis]CQR54819.1 peptidase S8 and S53 subtilisin kexin sedolisin [Paenibacillus riograndensis SBR5]